MILSTRPVADKMNEVVRVRMGRSGKRKTRQPACDLGVSAAAMEWVAGKRLRVRSSRQWSEVPAGAVAIESKPGGLESFGQGSAEK